MEGGQEGQGFGEGGQVGTMPRRTGNRKGRKERKKGVDRDMCHSLPPTIPCLYVCMPSFTFIRHACLIKVVSCVCPHFLLQSQTVVLVLGTLPSPAQPHLPTPRPHAFPHTATMTPCPTTHFPTTTTTPACPHAPMPPAADSSLSLSLSTSQHLPLQAFPPLPLPSHPTFVLAALHAFWSCLFNVLCMCIFMGSCCAL